MYKQRIFQLVFFYTFILAIANTGFAQTDTTFWFVAPDCTSGHAESPNYLRLTAQGQPVNVTVSQPANPAFTPISVFIAANSVYTVDLSSSINDIENTPYNQVLNKGLKITATGFITAYYEQASGFNPDIFPLKGRNALGTDFMVIAQNTWFNRNFIPTALNKFDIVATEDNTSVTITPSNDILGHAANQPFTIILNKGQTYCAAAVSTAASAHLGGSTVTSDKPIAITESDDSIQDNAYGGCADLAGDQLVPIPLMGLKYISIQGYLTGANDKVFIMAVQNGTQVKINGVVVANLNKGQIHSQASNSAPMYIEATKPVSALHISGFGCEVGGALLPQIECTGSKSVGVTRSENKPIYFNILVPAGGEGNFKYNGNSTTITASQFQYVPGSGNTWKYARIDMGGILNVGGSAFVSNATSNFHLGLINGDDQTGCRYGYFSDYNRFEAKGAVNSPLCTGDTLRLQCNVTGTVSDVTFQWTGPNSFVSNLQNPIIPNATASASGVYTCIATKSGCPAIPFNLNVIINSKPVNTASSNAPLCAGNSINLTTANAGTGASYTWTGPNGFSSAIQNPTINNCSGVHAGIYTLVVANNGCINTKTLTVVVNAAPTAVASNTGPYCEGQIMQLNSSSNNAGVTYAWTGPNNFSSSLQNPFISNVQLNAAGNYTVNITQPGCPKAVATTNVLINPGPGANISGVSPVCEGANVAINGNSPTTGVSYLWTGPATFSSTSQNLNFNPVSVNQSGTYTLSVTKNGCNSIKVFNLEVNFIPNFTAIANSPLCAGEALKLNVTSSVPSVNVSFSWSGPNGFSSAVVSPVIQNSTISQSGNYIVTGTAPACGNKSSQISVLVKPSPVAVASGNSPVCANSTLQLNASNTISGTSFNWYGPNGFNSILQNNSINNVALAASGNYVVSATFNGCTDSSSLYVLVKPIPSAQIGASFPACRFSNVQLNSLNVVPNAVYKWSTAFNSFTSNQQNLSIGNLDYSDTGKYYLTVSALGCTAKDSIIATLKPSPVIQFDPVSNLCEEENGFTIAANEVTGMPGNGLFTINGNISNGFFNPSVLGAGEHAIRYTFNGSNGCSQFKGHNIKVYKTPGVDAGPDKTILQGGDVRLNTTLTGNIAKILWTPSVGLNSSSIQGPTARPFASQTYRIDITSVEGCHAWDTVFVKVLGKISIPNAFSPNGDGKNDVWMIDGLKEFLGCDLSVYNRYGAVLFKSKGYAKPWDGKYKGNKVPVGTYYYILYLNDGFRKQPFSGWVVIVE